MKYFIRTLLTPSCWYRLGKTNHVVSRKIEYYLDNYVIIPSDHINNSNGLPFTIKMNGVEFWTTNEFYAFGHIYEAGKEKYELPTRRVAFKLYDALKKEMTIRKNKFSK